MKLITFFTPALLALLSFSGGAQSLVVPKEIRSAIAVDSATITTMVNSINQFLDKKDAPNKENPMVLKSDLPAMSILLDEMKGMDKNAKLKDDHFYKPYLENIVDLGKGDFLLQISYIGDADGKPDLKANFRIMAKRDGGQFLFYSVLKQSTEGWKTRKISYINFYYPDTLNIGEAKSYLNFLNAANKRLKVTAEPVEYYFCNDFVQALQVAGVDYKWQYATVRYDDLTSHENGSTLEICGGYSERFAFDRHDLWHDRLHMVMDRAIINRPVDEGCAYLYGGSWGKTWPEIWVLFKKYAAENPNADWLELYTGSKTFYTEGNKPFVTAYIINALIVQKIEREKGFAPVMELLGCGPRQKDDDNYFKALEKVAGISKADFNQKVSKLIAEE